LISDSRCASAFELVSFRRRSRSIEFDRFGSEPFFFNKKKERDQQYQMWRLFNDLWDVLGSGFLSSRFL